MTDRNEQTSDRVKAIAAKLNPMDHVTFVKHVASKAGFQEAKACIASALTQAPPRKKFLGLF